MQSKLGSLIESLVNIFIGIAVSFAANLVVLPIFGYPVTFWDGLGISLVFTIISLVRSYVIRRCFNYHIKKQCTRKPLKDAKIATWIYMYRPKDA